MIGKYIFLRFHLQLAVTAMEDSPRVPYYVFIIAFLALPNTYTYFIAANSEYQLNRKRFYPSL